MPRQPKPRLHKGNYVTEAGGRYVVLCPAAAGPEAAARALAAHLARLRGGDAAGGPTLREAFARYQGHCQTYYRLPTGGPSREQTDIRLSWRELLALAGDRPVGTVGKADVKAAVAAMVAAGLSRKVINQRLGRIKRGLAWLAGEDVIPEGVAGSAMLVKPLPEFRSPARETPPVGPAPDGAVEATVAALPAPWNDMMRLARMTGMRPGEVRTLRVEMFDPADVAAVAADPAAPRVVVADFGLAHKMAYRRRPRKVGFSPAATAVLAPWLAGAAALGVQWLFRSPRTGDRYAQRAMEKALERAIRRAGAARWHPNQLRHSFATEVRREHGLDAAQLLLGHASVTTTQVYAEVNEDRRAELLRKLK